jgi:hypothetical protein
LEDTLSQSESQIGLAERALIRFLYFLFLDAACMKGLCPCDGDFFVRSDAYAAVITPDRILDSRALANASLLHFTLLAPACSIRIVNVSSMTNEFLKSSAKSGNSKKL